MELELTQCPECGQPAEVIRRFTQPSTDGPVDLIKVRCVTARWFVTFDTHAAVEPAPRAPSTPAARPQTQAQLEHPASSPPETSSVLSATPAPGVRRRDERGTR